MLNLDARSVSIGDSDFLENILGSNGGVLNPIYIFGAGSATRNLLPFLNQYHVPVIAILDNGSPEVRQLFGIQVVQPTESIYKSATKVVVLVKNNREEILGQLIGFGFIAQNIIFPRIEVLDYFTLIYQWYYPEKELDSRNKEIKASLALYADEQSRQLFLHRLGLFTQGLDYRNYLSFLKEFSYPILNYHPCIESPENYFYFNNEIIKNDYKLFIDLGGHDGESTRQFLKRSNAEVDQIYIAEPDSSYYLKLVKEFSHYKENITIIRKAAWSSSTTLKFEQNGPQSTIRESGTSTVSTFTVDSLGLRGKYGLIKMDIEGAEMNALVGCAKTLCENHFDLVISAYHKKDDFITLTNYLSSLQIRYRYYLRHFGTKIYETCIIAKRF